MQNVKCNNCDWFGTEDMLKSDGELCPLCGLNSEGKIMDIDPPKYFRLYDKQTHRYMGTGYNAESMNELFDDYAGYKSNDWDESEQLKAWNDEMNYNEKIDFIYSDEFNIETSDTPFPEDEML